MLRHLTAAMPLHGPVVVKMTPRYPKMLRHRTLKRGSQSGAGKWLQRLSFEISMGCITPKREPLCQE